MVGAWQGAIEMFSRSLEVGPVIDPYYAARGHAHESLGNIRLACKDWQDAAS